MILNLKEIQTLIETGESQTIEFKASFQNKQMRFSERECFLEKEVIESVVSFANSYGGKILIGVDNNSQIIGISISDETIQNYINTIKQNTQPNIIVDINQYEISNEHLKTINSSWDYYVDDRHNFDDISQENIINLIQKIEKYQGKTFDDDPMTILRKYELIKDDKLTFGAYLLFTSNNSVLTAFQIGRFKSDTSIIANIDINTNLLNQIDIAIEFIKKHLMTKFIITGEPQRTIKYDYPLEAIREIVINMIVHRDYRDSGNSIIKIFDDRIEFFNPGKLYDDITIEKLNSGDYSSRTRNRAIARIFKESGIIEQYGSGISRIKKECKKHGQIEPKFEEFVHGFRVIIYKQKLDIMPGGVNGGVNNLLEFIQKNPNLKASQISESMDISLRTIERYLKQLKEENKIEFKGAPKIGGYFAK